MTSEEKILKELCRLSGYMERSINHINSDLLLLTPLLLKIVECLTSQPLHPTEAEQCTLLLKKERILGMYVDELDLSPRGNNALKFDDIKTIRQLIGSTRHELLRIPNVGSKSVNEIRNSLGKLGVHLKDDEVFFLKHYKNQ